MVAKLAEFRPAGTARTTFNVGRIGGGTSVNAIPAEAWMEVDLRSPDAAALKELEGRFQAAVDAAVADENARWGRAAQVTVEKRLVGDRPAGATPSGAAITRTATAVAAALGLPSLFSEASSDANLPMSLGIPAITMSGGGSSGGYHSEKLEWWSAQRAHTAPQNVMLTILGLVGVRGVTAPLL